MIKSQSLLVAVALVATPALAKDVPPYVGKWDCGVGVFTFTEDAYDPGDMPMKIAGVEINGTNYIMTMEDGYQVGVSINPDGSMSWLSMETGDAFDCTKVEE
jgi:hypothetical protein